MDTSGSTYDYLVLFHLTTAGHNTGELLGSDEEEIVLLTWLAIDVHKKQAVGLPQQHAVRPHAASINEASILNDNCKAETGLTEDLIRARGLPLDQTLAQFDNFVKSQCGEMEGKQTTTMNNNQVVSPAWCLVTDGPAHLRQCLHPEAAHKNVHLRSYFDAFIDLRKAFRRAFPHLAPPTNSDGQIVSTLATMLQQINVEPDGSEEFGTRHCANMAKIVEHMLNQSRQSPG